MRVVDLTHCIDNNMQVFPGDEPPSLIKINKIERDGYTNYRLICGMHIGTHIDGIGHMLNVNDTIDEIPADRFVGKACVIDVRNVKRLNDHKLFKARAEGCSIVLFYTGNDKYFGTEQYLKCLFKLDSELVGLLESAKIKLIGIDALSPDEAPHEIHKLLFSKNILIAENLCNLGFLPTDRSFELIALPIKIKADSAPARIIAII